MKQIFVVIPTYFDGKALVEIIEEISKILKADFAKFTPRYILVDDSGGRDKLVNNLPIDLSKIRNINLIKTQFNIGNQGAIIFGLKAAIKRLQSGDYVVVLDGDGEDDPQDINTMLQILEKNPHVDMVLAERGKRSSNFKFKFSLLVFKILFKILTGKKWKAGNFSVLRSDWLLQHYPLIFSFNSYAGSIQSLPAIKIFEKIDRKARRYGVSQTSNHGKILHALNSLTPWVETIQVRSLLFFGFMFSNFILSLILVSILKFVYHSAAPNWFTIVIFSTISFSLIALNIFLTSQMMISIINLTKRIKTES